MIVNVLGVILARGGSKRVPRKNVRKLGHMPLVCWTIGHAYTAYSLDRVVVSSDDDEILRIAEGCGVAALKRPLEFADDEASSYPALMHAIDAQVEPFDYVCLLQPTSPFRTHRDIDHCVFGAILHELAASVSVSMGSKVPNGAIYVARIDWLREALAMGQEAPFDGEIPCRFHMPLARSLDIDTEDDFKEAEAML